MSAHTELRSLRQRLHAWLASAPGSVLVQAEQSRSVQALPNLFGYHLIQLGTLPDADLLASSRISHRAVVEVDRPQGAGACSAVLFCDASALPFAADSVDVVVLPHVLEFEEDPHQVLREVERVLIAEGHVLLFGFNPWSLFGLWRLFLGWRGEPPWCGSFFRLGRVKDWLRLLGFDIVRVHALFFRPPLRHPGLLRRLAFVEKLGGHWWPYFGGVYCVIAKKRLVSMTPVKMQWKMRRSLIAAGIAEPSTRRAEPGMSPQP
ncbi:MAG: class I SAM-dependent methyltransferase [Gammaproteobacteria bacterium]